MLKSTKTKYFVKHQGVNSLLADRCNRYTIGIPRLITLELIVSASKLL